MTPTSPISPRRLALLALALAALLPVAGRAGAPPAGNAVPAELLARLAESDRRLEPFTKKGSCESRTVWEELDRHGAVKSRSEFHSKVRYDGGEMSTEVIRAVRDGEDVTAEERAKRAKEKAKKKESSGKKQVRLSFESPFAPSKQSLYRFRILGPEPSAPDRVRISYEPAGEKTVELSIGEAVVDTKAGRLIRLSGHPSRFPWFVDRMQVTLVYEEPTPLGSMLSKMEGEGEGGFLFIRKRMRMHGTFGDWKVEDPSSRNAEKR